MFEEAQGSSNEVGQEIDKEILVLAEELERTLVNLRQCEADLLKSQRDAESLEKSLQDLLEMLDVEADKVEIQERNNELMEIINMKAAYVSQMEEMLKAFKSVYEKQLSMFEKLKALKREMEHGFSGTSH